MVQPGSRHATFICKHGSLALGAAVGADPADSVLLPLVDAKRISVHYNHFLATVTSSPNH